MKRGSTTKPKRKIKRKTAKRMTRVGILKAWKPKCEVLPPITTHKRPARNGDVYVYQGTSGSWYWSAICGTGPIVADGSEGVSDRRRALAGFTAFASMIRSAKYGIFVVPKSSRRKSSR